MRGNGGWRDLLRRWRMNFARFMVGRYGSDELNQFLSVLILVLVVVSIFTRTSILFFLELALLVWIYFRMFSKNTGQRFKENQWYLNLRFQVTEGWKKWPARIKEARQYKIFKCPNCGQKLRIPRGHGKISIHCRKCGHDFTGKS